MNIVKIVKMKTIHIFLISVLTISLITGCQQQKKKQAAVAKTPAIKAQPDLKLSAVAEYIRDDGSRYITQQQYEIYSNPSAITLVSNEPYGRVSWSVQQGVYNAPETNPSHAFDKNQFGLMVDKDIAQGLMELYLAGIGKVSLQKTNETLNFNGQIYECVSVNSQNVKLFKNQKTGNIEISTSGSIKNGGFFLFYGYNYKKISKLGEADKFFASKVDIYDYKSLQDKKLLIQVNSSLK